jgi:predicted CXXCH cytochrome family protein
MGFKQWVARATTRSSLQSIAMAFAMTIGGVLVTSLPAQAQIAGTKHNLGTSGVAGNNQFSGTAEICVFCHTPHGADTSAAVPLWNRTLPLPSSFTTYDTLGTSTLDGKVAPVGSVSIACLSCHDGVTSMSAVINAPGSGTAGDAAWTGGVWSGSTVSAGTTAAGGGKLAAGAITNIGQDLKNDHPIGIQYGGGGLSTAAVTGTLKDADFKMPANAAINGTTVWWVDTEALAADRGTRQKSDMLLYTRAAGSYTGQTNPEPFVECASCHDPHTTQTTFLRISNAGSAVCLACHIK